MNIDHTILTVITFVPLAGAVLLALLPDKGKLMQWGALAVTLVTFALTLHLPIRYDYAAALAVVRPQRGWKRANAQRLFD